MLSHSVQSLLNGSLGKLTSLNRFGFIIFSFVRMSSNGKAFERLSRNVVPTNYFLSLKPDLKNWTFEGSEKVDIQVGSFNSKVFNDRIIE